MSSFDFSTLKVKCDVSFLSIYKIRNGARGLVPYHSFASGSAEASDRH